MTEPRDLDIRFATAFDVVNLSRLLMAARDETAKGIWYPAVADGQIGQMMVVDHVLAVIKTGVVVVADFNKRLVGCIGMSVDRWQWSSSWMMTNEWFYVDRHFRDSDIARGLLRQIENWADSDIDHRGTTKPTMAVMIGMLSGQQTGLKNKFMKQHGYTNGGGNFVRAPNEPFKQDNADHAA